MGTDDIPPGTFGPHKPVVPQVPPRRDRDPNLHTAIGSTAQPVIVPKHHHGPLARELATYDARKTDLLEGHEGEWVVIGGDEILGTWPTYEEALDKGYSRYGLHPFLAKQLLAVEPAHTFTRDVFPCRT